MREFLLGELYKDDKGALHLVLEDRRFNTYWVACLSVNSKLTVFNSDGSCRKDKNNGTGIRGFHIESRFAKCDIELLGAADVE